MTVAVLDDNGTIAALLTGTERGGATVTNGFVTGRDRVSGSVIVSTATTSPETAGRGEGSR
jgi:hypothetical protein